MRWRRLRGLLPCVVLCLWLASCGSSCTGEGGAAEPPDDAASGGGQPVRDGATSARADGGEPQRRDASAPDARSSEPTTTTTDASARDSALPTRDAASSEASLPRDGGASSLRARICGDTSQWPAPLPANMQQRTAQRVGSDRFGFVEGPVWVDELGVLLFSDMDFSGDSAKGPPARIRRLKPPATFDVFVASSGSNGLALSREGLLAATHDTQSLTRFDLNSGARTDLTVRFQGKRFNSPNDLAVRSDGTVYFSDPDWQLAGRTSELMGKMGLYRLRPPLSAGQALAAELVDDTLPKPNGVALSPDERTLYAGSSGNEVWKFAVASDGSLSGRTKFADVGGSDGMAVDCAGNLYVTSGTVEVFSPDGNKLGEIMTAESPSNAAFGGADHKTLYITAQTGIYAIALSIPGFPY
jgi:gluconolactonase